MFVGHGPDPTPESWQRQDPEGDPRPADYGEVTAVEQDIATVAWRFGATSAVPIAQLYKRNRNGPMLRYSVTFENMEKIEDVAYLVVTGGGQGKAIWLASRQLILERPSFCPSVVEVDELGEVLVDFHNPQIPNELFDPFEWM